MTRKRQLLLLAVCFFAYVAAQTGRYSYSANVTLIMDKFSIDHATASLPSTLFFVAYGLGQILLGALCRRFHRRLAVVVALALSGGVNLAVFLGASFGAIRYLWLLNGLAQACLWPMMMLVVRENVSLERITLAGIVMSISSTSGKLTGIALGALFAIDPAHFTYCFLCAALLMFCGALLFYLFTFGIQKRAPAPEPMPEKAPAEKPKADKKSVVLLLLLGWFALTCYAVYGGLQSWVPAILKESYGLSDAFSIFVSVLLPLFMISVAFLSPLLYKLLKNYVLMALVCFVFGGALIVGVLLFLDVHWLPVVVLFTAEAIAMGLVSNMTTVQVPLRLRGKFDTGFLAGFLGGTCYVGTALATYVLGAVADKHGWTGALWLLVGLAAFAALLSLLYLFVDRKQNKTNAGTEVSSS